MFDGVFQNNGIDAFIFSLSCFFFALELPLGRPPALDLSSGVSCDWSLLEVFLAVFSEVSELSACPWGNKEDTTDDSDVFVNLISVIFFYRCPWHSFHQSIISYFDSNRMQRCNPMLIRVTALAQPFAAISVMDISGGNQVSNCQIDCSFVCCLSDLFWVFFLEKSGLAHGDRWIDRTIVGRIIWLGTRSIVNDVPCVVAIFDTINSYVD